MDIMMPVPRSEADARYDLSRLAELLPLVGQHLATLGIETTTANALQVTALQLRVDIARAREAALAQQSRRIPA
jgi:hypothetical protein